MQHLPRKKQLHDLCGEKGAEMVRYGTVWRKGLRFGTVRCRITKGRGSAMLRLPRKEQLHDLRREQRGRQCKKKPSSRVLGAA